MMEKIDVFISRKTADAAYAKAIYDFLTGKGLSVFVSDQSLKEIGNAEYIKAIDDALNRTTHLLVVASSKDHILSHWVEAEWLFFLGRKRSGKATGNLFTVNTSTLKVEDVPPSLANYEVIPYNRKNFPIIYNYVREPGKPALPSPQAPYAAEKEKQMLWAVIGFLGMVSTGLFFWLYIQSQKPFQANIFIRPNPSVNLSRSYPPFKPKSFSLLLNGKEESHEVLSNGEVVFKNLPPSLEGEWVKAQLKSTFWKLEKDSFQIGESQTIHVVPDGSLGKIFGQIHFLTKNGEMEDYETMIAKDSVQIFVDTDTMILKSKGTTAFEINLPIHRQGERYLLEFVCKDYQPAREYYYPLSGQINIQLKPDGMKK